MILSCDISFSDLEDVAEEAVKIVQVNRPEIVQERGVIPRAIQNCQRAREAKLR